MLCIGATLFSGGLCVKPVGRWVFWKQGSEPGDRRVNALRRESKHKTASLAPHFKEDMLAYSLDFLKINILEGFPV